jgi:hypothetical protein
LDKRLGIESVVFAGGGHDDEIHKMDGIRIQTEVS